MHLPKPIDIYSTKSEPKCMQIKNKIFRSSEDPERNAEDDRTVFSYNLFVNLKFR